MNIEKSRYPGVYPFEKDQAEIFFGRELEIDKMLRKIESNKIITVHGKSGTGKSSLIKAGVIPKMEEINQTRNVNMDLFEIQFGYFSQEDSETGSLVDKFIIYLNSICPNFGNSKLDKIITLGPSIWIELKMIQFCMKDKSFLPVFFIDQLEELFSYPDKWVTDFIIQLAELHYGVPPRDVTRSVERTLYRYPELKSEFTKHNILEFLLEPIELKIITTIRSDRFDRLDKIKKYFPDLIQNTFELEALDHRGAKEAILKPASLKRGFKTKSFKIEDDLVDDVVQYLIHKSFNEKIEAFQLQLFCQYIEQYVIEYKKNTGKDLRKVLRNHLPDDLDQINLNFYQHILNYFNHDDQEEIRVFIEEEMVVDTKDEKRKKSLDPSSALEALHGKKELLSKLVDSKLLREVRTGSGTFIYEISHDALISPILKAKNERLDNDENQKRKKALLKVQEFSQQAIGLLKIKDYENSKEKLLSALELLESLSNSEKKQVEVLFDLGNLFLNQWYIEKNIGTLRNWNLLEETEKYLLRALDVAKLSGSNYSLGFANEKLGLLYQLQSGKDPFSKKALALKYYNIAFEAYKLENSNSKCGQVLEQIAALNDDPETKHSKLIEAKNFYLLSGEYMEIIRTEKEMKAIEFNNPWGYLLDLRNKHIFELTKYEYFIGRTTNNTQTEICFPTRYVSRKHMIINRKQYIEDTRSVNGTTHNAMPIFYGKSVHIKNKDIITLANTVPLLFLNNYDKIQINEKIPENGWAICLYGNKYQYLTENKYFISTNIENNLDGENKYKLDLSNYKLKNSQIFIEKTKSYPCKLRIKDGFWSNLIFTTKNTEYKYLDYYETKNKWTELRGDPYTCVQVNENNEIIEYGPSFQIIYINDFASSDE